MPLSNVPAGPFKFPKWGGMTLNSNPILGGGAAPATGAAPAAFVPSQQVVGSSANAANLAAAALPQNPIAAPAAPVKKPLDARSAFLAHMGFGTIDPITGELVLGNNRQQVTGNSGSRDRSGRTTAGGRGAFGGGSSARSGGLY